MQLQIERLGSVLLLVVVYLMHAQYYINAAQFNLLLSNAVMLVSLLFNNWLTYLCYLIAIGWQTILIFNISRSTLFFSRLKPNHSYSKCTQLFFSIEDQEINLLIYTAALWIFIRITSLKSLSFDLGNGKNFVQMLHGWNCTFGEFWILNLIWLIFAVSSLYACNFLIKNESDRNHLYREYLIKYKIWCDIVILSIVVIYNMMAYFSCQSIIGCSAYYLKATFIRVVWFWGCPLSTLFLFYKKHGVFFMKETSEHADQGIQMQEQLNRQEIDRQHSQISNPNQINFS